MKWLTSLVLLLLLPLVLAAEPMKHPVTGEDGFWVSRPQMEENVALLKERQLYLDLSKSLQLEIDVLKQDAICARNWVIGTSVCVAVFAGLTIGFIIWQYIP